MIYDNIGNLRRYIPLCDSIADILAFLEKNDAASLEKGRYDISDDVFVNVIEYSPGENLLFEAHRDYIDLQYIASGDEEIDFIAMCDAVNEREYDPSSDVGFYVQAPGSTLGRLYLMLGSFAFFEPGDPHRPGVKYRADEVKKLVFKIKVKE